MIRRPTAFLLTLLLALLSDSASAHKPSDSYLSLKVDGEKVVGQWDIALRDLDFAIGLDANQDGDITWGEVKAKARDIDAYALSRLTIGPAASPCPAVVTEHLIDNHTDGAYVVLRFVAACRAAPNVLTVTYRLFFDIDPSHRGLLNLALAGGTRTAIFSIDAPQREFTLTELSRSEQFFDYAREGVFHIWTGFDHILFLLSLLLPAVLKRRRPPEPSGWEPAASFRAAFIDVLKVVTAFTVAHSITLSLAALNVINLPTRLVESCIALSIVLAALNNIRPIVFDGRWIIAFCFGLIHGFGFASVLVDLGLPQGTLLLALVAFNLGVEAGQLVVVTVFLPVAYTLRATALYRYVVLLLGSAVIAILAGAWLIERAFNVQLR